jgi:sugar (pentulose or hexulose) kinase
MAGRWDWRWQALGLTPEKLPKVVPAGKLLGQISVEAAEHTGLPVGLPVISAGADKACEVMGAGCVPWQGALSFGTTATYNTVSHKYISLNPPCHLILRLFLSIIV